jgi:DNA polymerase epsilon subunit 3
MAEAKSPDFEPPQASVARIVKAVLPPNIQLTKDARAAFTRAAGVFIFYLTHCSNEFCKEGKRSTIYAADIKKALAELDFDELEGPFEEFMEVYRKAMKEEAALKKSKKIAKDVADAEVNEDHIVDGDAPQENDNENVLEENDAATEVEAMDTEA